MLFPILKQLKMNQNATRNPQAKQKPGVNHTGMGRLDEFSSKIAGRASI